MKWSISITTAIWIYLTSLFPIHQMLPFCSLGIIRREMLWTIQIISILQYQEIEDLDSRKVYILKPNISRERSSFITFCQNRKVSFYEKYRNFQQKQKDGIGGHWDIQNVIFFDWTILQRYISIQKLWFLFLFKRRKCGKWDINWFYEIIWTENKYKKIWWQILSTQRL